MLFRYMEETKQQAFDPGYVVTLTGRKRHFYLGRLNQHSNSKEVRRAQRQALNTMVQGPAAHLTMFAQVLIRKALMDGELRARLVHNVHDCLIVDAPDDEVPLVVAIMKECMENLPTDQTLWWPPFKLAVPLEVDIEVGRSWGKLEKYKEA